MSAPSDRRGFLRSLVSLPLIGGGVTLIGGSSANTASPDLLRFVEKCEAGERELDAVTAEEARSGIPILGEPWGALCRARSDQRAPIALFVSRNFADVSLKLRVLRSIDSDAAYLREEVASACQDWCYEEQIIRSIVADVMELEDAASCA